MAASNNTPTPRQKAFFTYMGFPEVNRMSKEQVDKIMNTSIHDWYIGNYNPTERQLREFHEKDWHFDRLVLYPELYARELREFLKDELPKELYTYVRGQFIGNSVRLTKDKLDRVYALLNNENPNWWHDGTRKKVFLDKLSQQYPGCCDGQRKSTNPAAQPDNPTGRGAQRAIKAKRRPGVFFWLVLIIIATAVWKLVTTELTKPSKSPNPLGLKEPSEQSTQQKSEDISHVEQSRIVTPQVSPLSKAPQKVVDPSIVTTIENLPLPLKVVTSESISLLNEAGKETEVAANTTILILSRGKLGSLAMKINGKDFVGNESRLANKAKFVKP
jgi:hypothetical protein